MRRPTSERCGRSARETDIRARDTSGSPRQACCRRHFRSCACGYCLCTTARLSAPHWRAEAEGALPTRARRAGSRLERPRICVSERGHGERKNTLGMSFSESRPAPYPRLASSASMVNIHESTYTHLDINPVLAYILEVRTRCGHLSRVAEGTGPTTPQQPGRRLSNSRRAKVLLPAR